MAQTRANVLHPLTTMLVTRFGVIAIDALNVAGMLKDHPLARAIADMGFGAFRRQLEYKAAQRGKTVVVVSRWSPSSKICSHCGDKMPNMPLAIRAWTCPSARAITTGTPMRPSMLRKMADRRQLSEPVAQ
jgi:putative transposase